MKLIWIGIFIALIYLMKFLPAVLVDSIKFIIFGGISFILILPLMMFADSPSAQSRAKVALKRYYVFPNALIWGIVGLWVSRFFEKQYYRYINIICWILVGCSYIVCIYLRTLPKFDKNK